MPDYQSAYHAIYSTSLLYNSLWKEETNAWLPVSLSCHLQHFSALPLTAKRGKWCPTTSQLIILSTSFLCSTIHCEKKKMMSDYQSAYRTIYSTSLLYRSLWKEESEARLPVGLSYHLQHFSALPFTVKRRNWCPTTSRLIRPSTTLLCSTVHCEKKKLMPDYQSAYRTIYSTSLLYHSLWKEETDARLPVGLSYHLQHFSVLTFTVKRWNWCPTTSQLIIPSTELICSTIHCEKKKLMPDYQSAYRTIYSTSLLYHSLWKEETDARLPVGLSYHLQHFSVLTFTVKRWNWCPTTSQLIIPSTELICSTIHCEKKKLMSDYQSAYHTMYSAFLLYHTLWKEETDARLPVSLSYHLQHFSSLPFTVKRRNWCPTTSQLIIPCTALLCSNIHCEKKKLMPDYQSAYHTIYIFSLLYHSLWKEENDARLPVSLSYHLQHFSALSFTVKRRDWCPTTSRLIIPSTALLCSNVHCEKMKLMPDYQSAYHTFYRTYLLYHSLWKEETDVRLPVSLSYHVQRFSALPLTVKRRNWWLTTSQLIIPSTAFLCSTVHCEKKKLMPDYQSAYRTTYSTSLLYRSLWKEETDARLPVSLSYHVQHFSALQFTLKRRNWCPTTSQLIVPSTALLCSTIHCEKKKLMLDYQSAYRTIYSTTLLYRSLWKEEADARLPVSLSYHLQHFSALQFTVKRRYWCPTTSQLIIPSTELLCTAVHFEKKKLMPDYQSAYRTIYNTSLLYLPLWKEETDVWLPVSLSYHLQNFYSLPFTVKRKKWCLTISHFIIPRTTLLCSTVHCEKKKLMPDYQSAYHTIYSISVLYHSLWKGETDARLPVSLSYHVQHFLLYRSLRKEETDGLLPVSLSYHLQHFSALPFTVKRRNWCPTTSQLIVPSTALLFSTVHCEKKKLMPNYQSAYCTIYRTSLLYRSLWKEETDARLPVSLSYHLQHFSAIPFTVKRRKWCPTTSRFVIPSTALLCSNVHCKKMKMIPNYQSAYHTIYSTSLLYHSLWKEETDARLPVSLSYHLQHFSTPPFTVKRRNWCPTTSQLIIPCTALLCSNIHCEKKKLVPDYQSAYHTIYIFSLLYHSLWKEENDVRLPVSLLYHLQNFSALPFTVKRRDWCPTTSQLIVPSTALLCSIIHFEKKRLMPDYQSAYHTIYSTSLF